MKSKTKLILGLIIFFTLTIHVGSLVVGKLFLEHWRLSHSPFHASVEISGSLIAFLVAGILLNLEKVSKGTSFNTVFAGALIAMGLLDGVHAMFDAGQSFVWFHSFATFAGGLLFFSIYIPNSIFQKLKSHWILGVSVITLGFIITSVSAPQIIPSMVLEGQFTWWAKFLNLVGGILLLLSSIKIFIVYKQNQTSDDLLFFMHCFLFGLAATMFQESHLWDITWWGWHLLRLMAYATALAFATKTLKETQKALYDIHSKQENSKIYEQLNYTLEASGIGLWDFLFSENYMKWDPNMYKLYGQDPKTFKPINDEWSKLLHDEDRDECLENFQKCVETQSYFDQVFRIYVPDGTIKYIRSKARFEYSPEGTPIRALGINWDVTEEHQRVKEVQRLDEKSKLQKSIIDQSAIVCESTIDGIITYVNQKFEDVYGFKSEEAVGKTHSIYDSKFHPKEFFSDMFQTFNSGEIWHGEVCDKSKDGKLIWLDTSTFPIKNEVGEVTGITMIRYDITQQKEVQSKLKKALEVKSNFLSNMSHEVRTPMNGILGASDLLLETPLKPSQLELTQMINDSTKSLLVIINDILDYSKLESEKLQLEKIPLDYSKLLRDVIQLMGPELTNKDLKIQSTHQGNIPPQVLGDPTRIRQILLNLLSNAIKFTEIGQISIKTSFEIESPQRGILTTSVQDTGIGMTNDQVMKIFERFTQADQSTSRKFGGSGLGTTISKKLIDLMQGQINVESTLGEGSIFTFKIPLEYKNETLPTTSQVNQDSTQFQGNILLVEDNRTNQMIASKILGKLGVNVTTTDDGQKALESLKANKFDLVLMDIQMPVMDGIQATQEIRKGDTSTPIIALTANVMQEDIAKYISLGMNAHLGKPFQKKDIIQILGQFLQKKD